MDIRLIAGLVIAVVVWGLALSYVYRGNKIEDMNIEAKVNRTFKAVRLQNKKDAENGIKKITSNECNSSCTIEL